LQLADATAGPIMRQLSGGSSPHEPAAQQEASRSPVAQHGAAAQQTAPSSGAAQPAAPGNSTAQPDDAQPTSNSDAPSNDAEPTADYRLNSDGILFRVDVDVSPVYSNDRERLTLFVPQPLVSAVLVACHDDHVSGGHMGPDVTLRRVRAKYYWPTLRADVLHWCDTCTTCQRTKTPHRTATLPQGTVRTTLEPRQGLHVDLMGPFQPSADGNLYVCALVDPATRFRINVAISGKAPRFVAQQIVNHWVTYFGVPRYLHSDQGTEFVNDVIRELCDLLGIDHTTTTPYRPQANSIVERGNDVVNNMMRVHALRHPQHWDRLLFAHSLAANTAYRRSVFESPFFLHMGYHPRLPIDIILGEPAPPTASDYRRELQSTLQEAYELLRRNSEALRRRLDADIAAFDIPSYAVGDQVWVAAAPDPKVAVAPKLQSDWAGPFQVLRVINPICVEVRMSASATKGTRFHIAHLRPYVSDTRPAPLADTDFIYMGRPLLTLHTQRASGRSDGSGTDFGTANTTTAIEAITARKPGRGRVSNLNQMYQVRYFGELDGSDWFGRRALVNRGLHDMVVSFDSRFALPDAVNINTGAQV
jgi:transposase InsO family protein